MQFISQATLVADQRKRQWLAQQKRRKAIELLITNKHQQAQVLENRREQEMFDELAMQKFVRNAFHSN
jgi:flagellar FliJ protein